MLRSVPWLFAFGLFGAGCVHPDYTEPVGGECFYRHEGPTTRDILCPKGEVPTIVTAYAHDHNFVVAKQTPGRQSTLYSKYHTYPRPRGTYYWIIDHRAATIDGPLSAPEYAEARARLGIPDDLTLD